jgi:oxaloacetate decarboxylase alpha subunit
MVTKEFKGIVKGEYGTTPAPISADFRKKIIGDEQPITTRPADALAPELDKLREAVKPWAIQEEDVLSYALFEQVAVKFFEKRKAKMYGLDSETADFENKVHNV